MTITPIYRQWHVSLNEDVRLKPLEKTRSQFAALLAEVPRLKTFFLLERPRGMNLRPFEPYFRICRSTILVDGRVCHRPFGKPFSTDALIQTTPVQI